MKAFRFCKMLLGTAMGLTMLLNPERVLFAQAPAPVPPGLVGWWRGEGNGKDATGAHNGSTPFGMVYVEGKVGQAFSYHYDNYDMTRVTVPDSPDLALTNSLTIEAWIYPKASCNYVFFRGDDRPGLDPYSVDCRTPDAVGFSIDDLDGQSVRVEAPIQYNQWQHIAATLDGASGEMKLYVNGVLGDRLHTTVRPGAELDPNANPGVGIGNVEGTFQTWPFRGMIDEVALYSRALTQEEIVAIYKAGSAGKCFAPVRPALLEHPLSQSVVSGSDVLFSTQASGTPPFKYQWLRNGSVLHGKTNSFLALVDVRSRNAGSYSVVVSNAVGAVTSSNAVLSVLKR